MTSVALHAGQLFQPVPGGTGRYVRELIRRLPGAGVTVEPFAAFPADARNGHLLPGPMHDLGWPGPPWRYELWHRLRRPQLRVPGDVVHAPSLAIPPHRGRPLVVTVHDLAFRRHPETLTARGVRFHERGLKIARAEATVVVAVSEFTRGELLDDGFTDDRIVVAHHGIDVPGELPSDAAVRSLGIERPYFVSVGTVEPRKNFSLVAAAFASVRATHPDVDLVIVGPDGWGTVTGIDGPGVHRVRQTERSTVDALLTHAIACVCASTYEGFGLPALEAMAQGCPVIVSEGGALAEVAGNAALAVVPVEHGAFAAAMQAAIEDNAAHTRAVAAGRARAGDFSWDRSMTAHRDAYERSRSGPPPGGS